MAYCVGRVAIVSACVQVAGSVFLAHVGGVVAELWVVCPGFDVAEVETVGRVGFGLVVDWLSAAHAGLWPVGFVLCADLTDLAVAATHGPPP